MTPSTQNATIVIVTYNSATTIADCLNSVLQTLRPDDEVILVDNDSKDCTIRVVEWIRHAHKEQVKLLRQSTNLGFAKACNLAIEQAAHPYIVLLNPDTCVYEGWLGRLLSHFQSYQHTGAVGPVSDCTITNQHVSTYLSDVLNYADDPNRITQTLVERFSGRSIPSKLLIGFCMALRRDLLEQFGGLDEELFLGIEDLEISWRLRQKGFLLRIALDAYVHHVGQVSFRTSAKEVTDRHTQEGSDKLYEKLQSHYAPEKVPHPYDLFGIDWWQPSLLQELPEAEVFAPVKQTAHYRRQVLSEANDLIAHKHLPAAIALLEDAALELVSDFPTWYTLGSIYAVIHEYEKAHWALKNARSLEGPEGRAETKLHEIARKVTQKEMQERLAEAEV